MKADQDLQLMQSKVVSHVYFKRERKLSEDRKKAKTSASWIASDPSNIILAKPRTPVPQMLR